VTTDRAGVTRRLTDDERWAPGGRAAPAPPSEGPWAPARDRRLGGRYRLGELLATGGMGEVWAAEDLVLDRRVAVKLLGGAFAGDGRAAERLRREARAAARLGHPGIARVLDLGEQDGRPYLVMELLRGESLAARLARAGPLAPAAAASVVATVADALEAAHRAGIVHRDVKPGNVFLTADGAVKVLDFGIASAAGEAALTGGGLLGTPAYLAPERVLGERATPAADIYALGVLLYELLAGRRPFEADSDIELAMAHVNAQPAPLGLVAPSAPRFLVAACEAAMAKDPAARVPSAAAFAELLRAPAVGPTTTLPGPPAGSPPLRSGPPHAAETPPRTWPLPGGRPLPSGRRSARRRRRGLIAALLVAGTLLSLLPALGDDLVPGRGRQAGRPATPAPVGQPAAGQPGGGTGGADPTGGADRAADRRPFAVDEDDRDRDEDSGGSGRSGGGEGNDGGGGDGDGGGSSGPG
jgi:eukaryotic-like serine/threonine-protein kinase